jgi:di/tripeptidase
LGGHNFHSTHEFISVEDMEKVTEILIAMVKENTTSKVLTKGEKNA